MSTPDVTPTAATWQPDLLSVQLGRIEGLLESHEKRFEAIDRRFDQVERRFEQLDRRLDAIERRAMWASGITWTLVVAAGLFARLAG